MNGVVYDAGALIAAERNDRRMWADHRVRLESDIVPVVPAVVVAQVSRSPHQSQLRRLLLGCEVTMLDEPAAHAIGALLGLARTSDVVDAAVVYAAMTRDASIVTSDRPDLRRLLDAGGVDLTIIDV